MPVLSHLHHLFHAEQCQTFIHMLRWQDRPLQCPRCQSYHIGRWGTYRIDLDANAIGAAVQAYQRPHQYLFARRPLAYWLLATLLLCFLFVPA